MNQIFVRDIAIAVLLSIITALLAGAWWCIFFVTAYLLLVFAVEEWCDRIIHYIHVRRQVKKLRNRKVLPPASKTGLIKNTTP